MEKQEPCRIVGESMYFELKENKPHGTKDNPFSIYHIENAGRSFQIPVHWHDEFEIIYVKSGLLTVSISGESYIGKAGDAFVVSPGNLHLMGSQTGTVDYFTFLFPLKYISFRTDDMLDDKLLEPLNSGHLMINPRVKDSAKELCEQLIDIYMAENDETESKITAQIKTKIILLQFILEMWKKGFVIENDTSGRNIVEKEMVSYIQQNFTGKISLKEFGEQFHLSEKYISRYFKEHFHITLSQYITYLRLENAKQLLQDTDLSVTETAMQSGYQNVSYFIRSFKKTYGISPLKYRNSGILIQMIKIIDKGVGTKRVLTLFLIAGTWIIKQFVDDPMILGVCMVMLATPVGSMTAMLAQQYDGNYDLAARGVALTAILAVVTMPVVSVLMGA